MEKYLVDIHGFNHGEVSDYFNSYNKDYNYYTGAKKLENIFITDNNVLIRRFNSNFVRSYPKEGFATKRPYPVFYCSFEHNGNAIGIEALTKVPEEFNGSGIFKIYIGTANPIEIAMPYWSYTFIFGMRYTTDLINNKVYFFSDYKEPFVLTFTNTYQFTTETINFIDGPFLDANTDLGLTVTPSATDGNAINLTLNKPLAASFATSQLRYIRIAQNGIWGIAAMYARQGDYIVKANVIKSFANLNPTNVFRLGAHEVSNLPPRGAIFNNRLYIVGGAKNKKYIFASKTNEFNNFATTDRAFSADGKLITDTITTDSAMNISLTEGKEIKFIASLQDSVIVGTQEGLFNITAIKFDEKISQFNYKVNKLSSTMCGKNYVVDDNRVIYSDYFNKNLYMVETYQDKAISFQHINIHSKHLFTHAIKQMLITYFPFKILWLLLENGTLLSASFISTEKGYNFAFAKQNLGGFLYYISKAYNTKSDCVFLFIDRPNGLNAEVINLTNLDFLSEHNKAEVNNYLDCKITETAINGVIYNLNHFNLMKIYVVHNNTLLGEFLVQNNQIKLPNNNINGRVDVGYKFVSTYQTPYINHSQNQSSFGLYKSINNISVGFINTKSIALQDAFNQNNNTVLNLAKNNKNDFIASAHFKTNSSFNPSIILKQSDHTPMNIMFIKLNILSN
jgi:hypothetical protein